MQPWKLRTGLLVVLFGASWLLVGTSTAVTGQTASATSAQDQMQVVSTLLANGTQQIVVVDPNEKSMAVYHVEPLHGKIQLKSVRRLLWDLRMEQFNAQTPLPSELREVQP